MKRPLLLPPNKGCLAEHQNNTSAGRGGEGRGGGHDGTLRSALLFGWEKGGYRRAEEQQEARAEPLSFLLSKHPTCETRKWSTTLRQGAPSNRQLGARPLPQGGGGVVSSPWTAAGR